MDKSKAIEKCYFRKKPYGICGKPATHKILGYAENGEATSSAKFFVCEEHYLHLLDLWERCILDSDYVEDYTSLYSITEFAGKVDWNKEDF